VTLRRSFLLLGGPSDYRISHIQGLGDAATHERFVIDACMECQNVAQQVHAEIGIHRHCTDLPSQLVTRQKRVQLIDGVFRVRVGWVCRHQVVGNSR